MKTARQYWDTFTSREAATNWRTVEISVVGGAAALEHLLLDTVWPWIAKALAAGWLDGWYLTRPPRDPAAQDVAVLELHFRGPDHRRLSDLTVRVERSFTDQPGGRATGVRVRERGFTPDIERFGGPYGTAVCLSHQMTVSRIVIDAIETAPTRQQRLRVAALLLAASTMARGTDQHHGAAWLRRYAGSQVGFPAAADNPDYRQGLLDNARSAITSSDDTVGTWFRSQRHTWSALAELHAAGRLSASPDAVFGTLARMAHDQLGLRPADRTRTIWLVSLALTADGSDATNRGQRRYDIAS